MNISMLMHHFMLIDDLLFLSNQILWFYLSSVSKILSKMKIKLWINLLKKLSNHTLSILDNLSLLSPLTNLSSLVLALLLSLLSECDCSLLSWLILKLGLLVILFCINPWFNSPNEWFFLFSSIHLDDCGLGGMMFERLV